MPAPSRPHPIPDRLARLAVRLRDDEDGLALVVVMAFLVIMTLFATMVLATLTSTQEGSRLSRNVATASAAADAGAEDVIFDLGVTGSDNWDTYPCAGAEDPMTAEDACVFNDTVGDGEYWVTVTPVAGETDRRQVNAVGEFPAGNGDRRMVRVVVERTAPAAFRFSMFADQKIEIGHDGSSLLAPQITTTSAHSNGGASISVPAELNVGEFTVVDELELSGDDDGNVPNHDNLSANASGGTVGPRGYSFRYDLLNDYSGDIEEDRCHPTWNPFSRHDVSSPGGTYPGDSFVSPGNGCDGNYFAGNATIVGDVHAGSLNVSSRGVVAGAADYASRYGGLTDAAGRYSVTGDLIDNTEGPAEGNVRVSTGGGIETPNFTANSEEDVGIHDSCNGDCGVDSGGDPNTHAGKIGGTVTVAEDGGPSALEYPSIDYAGTYLPRAQAQQDGTAAGCPSLDCNKQHVFESNEAWLDYVTERTNGFYQRINDEGSHKSTTGRGIPPDYILLRGDWYVKGEGGVNLDPDSDSDINDRVAAQFNHFEADSPAIPIVVAGSLIAPDGGMTLNWPLYVVGSGSNTQFFECLDGSNRNSNCGGHLKPDVCRFLNRARHPDGGCETPADEQVFQPGPGNDSAWSGISTVEPGVLAAGGNITVSDKTTDEPWQDADDYQPESRNPTWVRGVVYAGEWDEDEQRTRAKDQHWQNEDPKNSMRIFGAQVGSTLKDSNNFFLTYDNIVEGVFGFSVDASDVKVISWDELGAPS